jgi:uncharacterized Zn finger protein
VIPKLSEATIRSHATTQSFDRGQSYYEDDSVDSLVQRGNTLFAKVEGSEVEPYRITIQFDKGGITHALCTCPYDYDGWCKHIIATLLTCLHQPEQVEQRPEFAEILAPLSHEQLKTIVQNLANEQPEWMEAIEYQITLLTASKTAPSKKATRRTTVDPKPIERQVERIIDRYSEQWNDEPALDEIRNIIQKADEFLEQGDGNNALIVMGAIIRAYVQDWMNLDGSSGESGDFFKELDDALTEAILSAEWSDANQQSQRRQWQKELEDWQKEVDDYGAEGFEMSLAALEQGWDYPPLHEVLQGNVTERGAWEGEVPDFADDLARIRLKILERQERYQEYLYFAEAEGQLDRYLQMLAKLGRSQEAIALAEQEMSTAAEAWTLAQTLREQGELEQALQIAVKGLSLGGYQHYPLAVWASELAEGLDHEIALQARLKAFQLQPSLTDYLKLKELAGQRWASLQAELLTTLRQNSSSLTAKAKAAIFLEEGLIDDAIATVDQLSSYESDIIHLVMDAAIAQRPEWVIANARRRAESIMNEGKAQYYYYAINWLRKVRAAYLQLGQKEEWKRYRTALLQTHARKRKLTAMLQQRDLT